MQEKVYCFFSVKVSYMHLVPTLSWLMCFYSVVLLLLLFCVTVDTLLQFCASSHFLFFPVRSNPELIVSCDGDSDSDGGISSSQAASRLLDRLQAVRSFILSDSSLYSQILQYQPLVLSQLQQQLKAAGIRLGAAKLVDYLDSQCITFTTAKPGQSAPSRRRGGKTNKGARGASRKKGASSML